MAEPKPTPRANALEQMFEQPLTQPPEGEDGIGPTLGQDVSVEHEREEDARHGAHSIDEEEG